MTGFSDPILTGAGTLIRQTEQSDNFQTGVAGWQITRAGNAEFNSGTFRGTLQAATIIGGTLETSASNPRIVIDGASDTIKSYDAAGNVVAQMDVNGFSSFVPGSLTDLIELFQATLNINPNTGSWNGGSISATDHTTTVSMTISSPSGVGSAATIVLTSQSNDLATPAAITVNAVISRDTWHSLPITGWAVRSPGGYAAQYRLTAESNVQISAELTHASVSGTSTLTTALPAAYRPATPVSIPLTWTSTSAPANSSPSVVLDTSGVLTAFNLPAGTTQIAINATIPLDL